MDYKRPAAPVLRCLPEGSSSVTGTLINVGAVLAGGSLGLALSARLPERLCSTTRAIVGLVTLVIGFDLALRTQNPVVLLASLLLGGLLGEWLDIEAGLVRLSHWVEAHTTGTRPGSLPRGFLAASLLFCVGPLTILGSFQDGLTGDFSLLATKSALDGASALVLAASLGFGVLFSALTVLLYQGGLTLAAGALRPILNDAMVREMSATGGVIIVALGLGLLELRSLRPANLLPALLVAPLLVALVRAS
jgi:uncharacterized membrane protein YqgA involved in biofilm formation